MLRNVSVRLGDLPSRINYFTPTRNLRRVNALNRYRFVFASTLASAGATLLYLQLGGPPVIRNDSETLFHAEKYISRSATNRGIVGEQSLDCLVWGSNRNSLIVPTQIKSVRTPQPSPSLINAALRDLKLHETHGACLDARGDLYQWGSGFSQDSGPPRRTLSGIDATDLALTSSKVFALSRKSGKIYAVASERERQTNISASSNSPWMWVTGGNGPSVDFVELKPDVSLSSGEKFTSISTGSDHLVALTSKGRTFAMPVSLRGNSHGQLGYRKATVAMVATELEQQQVELTPEGARDPLALATPFRRSVREEIFPAGLNDSTTQPSYLLPLATQDRKPVDDTSIRFCTTISEIPSLRGITVSQIATGSRSTYVRVDGRALAWGANEHGQLGLGGTVTLPYVTVPTEISFIRGTSAGTSSTCDSIVSAGDVAYFLVRRLALNSDKPSNEVLACGHGQWGTLGNGLYSSAQGEPARIKAVSGLMEYSELEGKVRPLDIHAITPSPTGHTMLSFDTVARSGPGGVRGLDLVSWGQNRDFELGNGKRASQAVPGNIPVTEDMRFMLLEKESEVKDMKGKRWAKNVLVKQTPVGGYGCTLVYWKIESK